MATIAGVHVWIAKGVLKSTWAAMGDADTGLPLDAPNLPDKTIQVLGTFGSATVVLAGSNDGGTTYHTLNDSRGEGNALSFTTADTRTVLENTQLMRPVTSGGTGSALTVVIVSQSQQR